MEDREESREGEGEESTGEVTFRPDSESDYRRMCSGKLLFETRH